MKWAMINCGSFILMIKAKELLVRILFGIWKARIMRITIITRKYFLYSFFSVWVGFEHCILFFFFLNWNHISVSDTSVCHRSQHPFWNGGYIYHLTITAYKYQPKLRGLKLPQPVISYYSVGPLGAGQGLSAVISWALLCSQLEALRKWGLSGPTAVHPGLLVSGFWESREKLLRPFEAKAWKSHIIPSTTFFCPEQGRGQLGVALVSWWSKTLLLDERSSK